MAEILAASPVEALHEQLKTLSVTKQKPNGEKDVQDGEDTMDERRSSGSRKQDDENDSKEGLSMASGISPGGDATPKQPVQLAPTRRLAPNFEVPYKPSRRNSSKKKQPPKRSQSAIGFPGHQTNPPPVHHSLSSPALEEEETRQRGYKRTTSMVSTSSDEIQAEFENLHSELVQGYLKDNPDGMLKLSLSSPLPPNDVSNYSSSATSVSSGNSGMYANSPKFFDEETRRENTPFGSSSNSSGIGTYLTPDTSPTDAAMQTTIAELCRALSRDNGIVQSGTRVTVSRQDGQDEMRIRLTPQKTTKDIAKGISAKVFSRPNVSAFTLVSEDGDPVPLHKEIGENELRMRMVPVGEHDEWTWKVTRDGGIQAREDDEIFFDIGHFN
ncbi:uncharacterized protein [Ptychodera flava]|uniref:uncharacterized protein isoform X1 n=1 Tax=Ptychodera flava TaxID=63121 RepID=UPI00396A7E74